MTPRRRADDADDSGVLSRQAAPVARFVRWAWAVAAAICAGLAATYALDHRLAVAAAQEVVEARVGPVEKRLDDHLASGRALREVMDRYVLEERAARRSMAKKLDALCRANPRADCPLGDD